MDRLIDDWLIDIPHCSPTGRWKHPVAKIVGQLEPIQAQSKSISICIKTKKFCKLPVFPSLFRLLLSLLDAHQAAKLGHLPSLDLTDTIS